MTRAMSRWQFSHPDGRVLLVYASSRAAAGKRLAAYVDIPAAAIACLLVRVPSLDLR